MNIYRKQHENFTQKEKKIIPKYLTVHMSTGVLKALKYPHVSMCVCVCVVSLVTTEALYPQS